jgi:hypothetical protein
MLKKKKRREVIVRNTKHIAQKSLGAKIVRHLLKPGMEVLANKHGDMQGNIF